MHWSVLAFFFFGAVFGAYPTFSSNNYANPFVNPLVPEYTGNNQFSKTSDNNQFPQYFGNIIIPQYSTKLGYKDNTKHSKYSELPSAIPLQYIEGTDDCYPIMTFTLGVMAGYLFKTCPGEKPFIQINPRHDKHKIDECPPGWFQLEDIKDRCFRFTVEEGEWEKSRIECNELGGNLVIIKDKFKSEAIRNYLKTSLPADLLADSIWIGLNDILDEAKYKWDPTKKFAKDYFEDWDEDFPTDKEEYNCVVLLYDKDWFWGDVDCEFPKLGLCERFKDEKFKCHVH